MTAIQARGAPIPHSQDRGESQKSWISALFERLNRLAELYMSRRALFVLSRADERMLKDIGVSRGDIDWALSQPWHIDGTLALAERIECRRSARRTGRRLTGH